MAQMRLPLLSRMLDLPRSARSLVVGYLCAATLFSITYAFPSMVLKNETAVLKQAATIAIYTAAFFFPMAIISAGFEAWRNRGGLWPYVALVIGVASLGATYWLASRCSIAIFKSAVCVSAI
jgi:hypothetical protein